jgi:multidrug efflux pump subunit AcrA (membrane-fusion protein)
MKADILRNFKNLAIKLFQPHWYSFIKRKSFFIPFLVILMAVGGYAFANGKGEDKFEAEIVSRGTVTQIVSEIGFIKPSSDVSLSFARGGRVQEVYAYKGKTVRRGDILAVLDAGSLQAELRQARASLDLEQNSTEKTELTFTNARLSLLDVISNAYLVADDVISVKVDQFFSNPNSEYPKFGISISQGLTNFYIGANYNDSREIEQKRVNVRDKFNTLESDMFQSSGTMDVKELAIKVEGALLELQTLLNTIAKSLNTYVADNTNSQMIYDGYKSDISGARTRINSTITSLRTSLQNYNTAQASIHYSVDGSVNPNTEITRFQDIRIEDAKARVDAILSRINDGYIRSPIDGTVAEAFISRGETVGAASPAISVISTGKLEIVVNIPEVDIENIDIGDKAKVKFDAYRNSEFNAEVVYLSSRAKEIGGIRTFEVILEFDDTDPRIKAGLSVDLDIIAMQKEGLIIPRRAVVHEGADTYVRVVVTDGTYRKQSVVLGLRGEGGIVEIINGLSEGDKIITFINSSSLKKLKQVD